MKTTMEKSIVARNSSFLGFSNLGKLYDNNEENYYSNTRRPSKRLDHFSFLLCFILSIFLVGKSHSQYENPHSDFQHNHSGCKVSEMMQEHYQNHPEAIIERDALEEFTNEYIKQKASGFGMNKAAATYTIPVVFHVYGATQNGVTVTLAKIQGALAELNKEFNGLNADFNTVHNSFLSRRGTISINFALAQKDPNGNATTGVEFLPAKGGYANTWIDNQIAADAWDNYKYMNVYIQGDIYDDGSTFSSGVAWYPSVSMSNAGTARVVYNGLYLGTNTDAEFAAVLTHEFGHFMNLAHTFDNGCNSPTGDNVADTPPCSQNYDNTDICHPTSTANSPLNCFGNLINAENYMDYRGRSNKGWVNPDIGCYKMFTQGQITRIEAALQDPARITLWQTSNLIATGLITNNLTASVVISSNATTICTGTSVTFTAVPTNGGTTPSYQWKVNGVNAGTNSAIFTTSLLTNGQTVTCIMTSNLPSVLSNPATSNSIAMVVTSSVAPTIAIAVTSGSNPSCLNSPVTFTATAQNGGTSPAYQWKVDGVNVGTNSNSYSSSTLANGAIITCQLTSNSSCASPLVVLSSGINFVINSNQVPSVSIGLTTGTNPACMGTNLIFTASPVNGGSSPNYQWKVNGGDVGTNAPTFSSSLLANTDVVTCVMTSSLACAVPQTAASSPITMVINSSLSPTISISQTGGPNPICTGSTITFTATIQNGGTTPIYQWKVDGVNTGTNSSTFTTSTLTSGQIVTCQLTSNAVCASSLSASSNGLAIVVNSIPTASLVITQTSGANPTCAGAVVTFTATPTNGGTVPSYQWKIDGVNVGTSFSTYSSSSILNNQVVTCEMLSTLTCASTVPSVSNAITLLVNVPATPVISIAQTIGTNPSCASTSLQFTATIQNGGANPSYQWKVDGVNAGNNSSTYTSTSISDGQVITCQLTSNGACVSPLVVYSNQITMQITAPQTPSVGILLTSGSNPTCVGSPLTFTATSLNGGTNPSYQWKVNGVDAGTNSDVFTSSSITANQTVTCVLTTSATCVSSTVANSNGILITVTSITPTVTITQNGGTAALCAGSLATFNVTSSNGGSSPQYQWKVDGVNVGTNSTSYSTSTLTNNQIVSCVLTSSLTCVSPQTLESNGITVVVNTPAIPAVSILQTVGASTICAGSTVEFGASPTFGGTNPAYQWKVNGVNAGGNSNTFTTNALTNGQTVTCVLTSNASCVSSTTANSNSIAITVNPILTPTVVISQTEGSNPTCAGTLLSFSATINNGGSIPAYTWKIGGVTVGTNSSIFSTSSITNGQVVTCQLTSNASCISSSVVNSTGITIVINSTAAPTASLTQSFCSASTVANLVATGSNLKWYSSSAGGTNLPATTSLVNGTTYYGSQTVAGCESTSRVGVLVSIAPTAAPTGPVVQSFCNSGTIGSLVAQGNIIKWYTSAVNGVLLTPSTPLVNGSVYYATQTISGCESTTRLAVTVSVSTVNAPVGSAVQTFCNSAVLSDLVVTGNSINWYSLPSGGNVLQNTVSLANGATYYASQTILGCQSSTRLAVTATVQVTAAPTGATSQTYCPNSTVSYLIASGTALKWYASASGGSQLLNSAVLNNGTTYYASQTVNGCESATRLAVSVTIGSTTPAPTGNPVQAFCGSANISNLVATGNGIRWYYLPVGGTPIVSSTAVSNGFNYYASQTINGCESLNRFTVAVTLNAIPTASLAPIPMVCKSDAPFTLTQGTPIGGVYSGPGVSNGMFNPESAPLGDVNIVYTFTNFNMCSATVQTTVFVDDCIGVDENEVSTISIYPNPASDHLTIISNFELINGYQLIDQNGRILFDEKLNSAMKEVDLNVVELSNGIYFLKVRGDFETKHLKIMIKK